MTRREQLYSVFIILSAVALGVIVLSSGWAR
jgi:hypothetical protein